MTSISNKKSLSDMADEGIIEFSGSYSSGNLILSSIAKIRRQAGIIKQAKLRPNDDGFFIDFYGANGKPLYKGNALTLSGSNDMSEPDTLHTQRNFRNEQEAVSFLKLLGFKDTEIITN